MGCLEQNIPGHTGFVAFNAHIAAELQRRLPPEITALSLHSLGLACVRRHYPHVVFDENKLRKLAEEVAATTTWNVRRQAESLARLCKYTLTPEDNAEALRLLAERFDIELTDENEGDIYQLCQSLVRLSGERQQTLDFDDMVWWPVRHNLTGEQFDLLLVDEAQDLNALQQAFVLNMTRQGRLCPIGDRFQAIYGFAGADVESLATLGDNLRASQRGGATLPLTITWRCPASHVSLAQRLVPDLQAAPQARPGRIETAALDEISQRVTPGDLIISRRNAPLLHLAHDLIRAGKPARVRGRDIGRGLLSLLRRLRPDTLSQLSRRLADYREQQRVRLDRRQAPISQYESLTDRCDCLADLADQVSSIAELQRFIENNFTEAIQPDEQIVLSSIHRAKGLEADTVYVLDTPCLPLKYRGLPHWQKQQERNLVYIAVTRSKNALVFQDEIPSILT